MNNIWKVKDQEIAKQIDVMDLPGLFLGKQLEVAPFNEALVVEDGRIEGELRPGAYTLENFTGIIQRKIGLWSNKRITAVVINKSDIELQLKAPNLPTSQGVWIVPKIVYSVSVVNSQKFYFNLMQTNEYLDIAFCGKYIDPILVQAITAASQYLDIDDIVIGKVSDQFEKIVKSEMVSKISRYGMQFNGFVSVNAISPELNKIREMNGKNWMKVREHQIVNATEKIQEDIDKDKFDSNLRKAKTFAQNSELLFEIKLENLKSREEFETELDKIENSKNTRIENKARLLEEFDARKEDRASLREHLVNLMNLERQRVYDEMDSEIRHALEKKSIGMEIELAELNGQKSDQEWLQHVRREAAQIEERNRLKKLKIVEKWDRIRTESVNRREEEWMELEFQLRTKQNEYDLVEAQGRIAHRATLLALETKKAVEEQQLFLERKRGEWELENKKAKSDLQIDRMAKLSEINLRVAENEQRAQLEKIRAMGGLGAEALIALSGDTQAEALAKAIAEKARASSGLEFNEERKEMYRSMQEAQNQSVQQLLNAGLVMGGQLIQGAAQLGVANQNHLSANTQAHRQNTYQNESAPSIYVALNGQQTGPFGLEQVKQKIFEGLVGPSTLLWKAGLANWTAAERWPELAGAFGPPPVPPQLPPPPIPL